MTTPKTQALDALRDLSAIAEFAYAQGFHELGYDPVLTITAALTPSRADTAGDAGLWCLHIIGPDDIHPAPSKAHAEAAAILSNAATKQFLATKPNDGMWPHIEAVAIPYPYSAESHAESAGDFIATWLIPKGYAPAGDAHGVVDGFDTWWKSKRVDSEFPETLSDRDFAKAAWDAALAAAPTPATPSGSQAGEV